MTEKYEFASPGWLKMTCEIAEQQIRASGIDLKGIEYTFGEEFTDVPERLHPPGGGRIGFCIRVADGKIETASEPPPPDADSRNTADWETTEPFAHAILGEDPARDAELGKRVQELQAQGKMRIEQKRERPPELDAALADMHNAVCRRTAPRQD